MTRRPPDGGSAASPLLDALGLALVATALAVFTVTLVVIPQLIAQRPSSEGVLTLRVDSGGGLRAWNQPIGPDELPALLDAARSRRRGTEGGGMRLRLVADARVPWGTVKGLVARLEATGLPLELQLP